jgi:ubiquinone/menaquinone biosynthesis C-methylase UbiE
MHASGRLLDAGCGLGFFLREAAKVFNETYGMDVSEYAIEQSKTIIPQSILTVGGVEKIPYQDNFFDAITAFDVVEHLKDPHFFFRESFRTLKKGGVLVFSTPNPESWGAKRKGSEWFGFRDTSHCSIKSITEWRKEVNSDGFHIIQDGTDTLWDVPYFKKIPIRIQWLFFISTTWILIWWKGFFKWKKGENYYCIACKK